MDLDDILGLITLFHTPAVSAIFAGAALTAMNIGIISKVLSVLGFLKLKEDLIIVVAAVIDDVLGIIDDRSSGQLYQN